MPTRLEITFEGDAPALAPHGLSIAAFASSLQLLLKAIRRIGSAILTDAAGEEYGAKGGRWARYAEGLDFVLHEVHSGSPLRLTGSVVQPELPPSTLFPNWNYFTDQIGERFITAVRREGVGQPDNFMVRRFLDSIPKEVERHIYSLTKSTGENEIARLDHPALVGAPSELPYLQELIGWVTGVGFDPGRVEVRLKFDSQFLSFSATTDQVEKGLELREQEVRALVVRGGQTNRLLRLERHTDPRFQLTPELQEEYLFERWDGLLKRLAQ